MDRKDLVPHGEQSALAKQSLRWLDRRLARSLMALRLRAWTRILLGTLSMALLSAVGAFLYAAQAAVPPGEPMGQAVFAAELAAVTSFVTSAVYSLLIRKPGLRLFRAGSMVTRNNLEMLFVLGKLAALRDTGTAGHNMRVTLYTMLFAEALELAPEAIMRAVKGALLHDIGKLVVPDRILTKPGPLTPDERAEMATHVERGMEVVAESHFLTDAAALVVYHHERFDGTGYPRGLKGEEIPDEARMFALIDVFDALTSARAYKAANSVDEAIAIMARGRGSHFDPLLFDRFARVAPDFARQVPDDEMSQIAMLLSRLAPYADRILRHAPPPMQM